METLTNINNFFVRNLGILDLLPDVISAQKACCQYSRTIFLPSKFRLPR